MSSKKEKADAAADRIKAAAMSAAKGLSRTQAEKAATAAARNVNAYGQKEEGPSRWQERKEAKRQMYLMSTERAVILGVRKDGLKPGTSCSQQCQKCFQIGHWTYECKNERMYVSRPTRTQLLVNPNPKPKLMDSSEVCLDRWESQQRNVEAHNDVREEKKKNERMYVSRPTRTQLRNPKLRPKLMDSFEACLDPRGLQRRNVEVYSDVREGKKRNECSGERSDSSSVESYVEIESSGGDRGKSRCRKSKRQRRSLSSSTSDDARRKRK